MTEKNCGTCDKFKGGKRRVFCSDGFCYLVPSKPIPVSKTLCCKFWVKNIQKREE